MARNAVVVGKRSEVASLASEIAWNEFEVKKWVEAYRQRGFDLRYLDDHSLRMACYAEANRQIADESAPKP
jgi:hypothetical protein